MHRHFIGVLMINVHAKSIELFFSLNLLFKVSWSCWVCSCGIIRFELMFLLKLESIMVIWDSDKELLLCRKVLCDRKISWWLKWFCRCEWKVWNFLKIIFQWIVWKNQQNFVYFSIKKIFPDEKFSWILQWRKNFTPNRVKSDN